jgi:uncharacterized glyoxalase superfamily protein PhnB
MTRTDHNIWTSVTYDDPIAARRWLAALGFREGILVMADDSRAVQHSEMYWPEGGRVMISSRAREGEPFLGARGKASTYVVVDDPDEVYARAKDLGARIVREIEDTDYGSRGFSLEDPEGNGWSFGTYAGSDG